MSSRHNATCEVWDNPVSSFTKLCYTVSISDIEVQVKMTILQYSERPQILKSLPNEYSNNNKL